MSDFDREKTLPRRQMQRLLAIEIGHRTWSGFYPNRWLTRPRGERRFSDE